MGWEYLDRVPERLLKLMGFSMFGFMGFVEGRPSRMGVEMKKWRLIEWALKERERERNVTHKAPYIAGIDSRSVLVKDQSYFMTRVIQNFWICDPSSKTILGEVPGGKPTMATK
jgi:hypothetical protein